ncbi:MAG: hypothetical protein K8L99_17795 [Anaerolineae bacterium]|nr:hypothetical protein [Anaerolineae bacterium]
MSYHYQLEGSPQHIAHITFSGHWEWEEIIACREEIRGRMHELANPLDFIIEWEKEAWVPPRLPYYLPKLINMSHEGLGTVVCVSETGLFRGLLTLYRRYNSDFGFDLMIADSLEEAQLILEHKRDA